MKVNLWVFSDEFREWVNEIVVNYRGIWSRKKLESYGVLSEEFKVKIRGYK